MPSRAATKPKTAPKSPSKSIAPSPGKTPAKPFTKPQGKARLDLRTPLGAFVAVFLLRMLLGLWALLISVRFPETRLEKTIAFWPPGTALSPWLERVFVAPWMRWDATQYVSIMMHGYDLKKGQPAFHPLFLIIAKPLHLLGLSPGAALLIVSFFASFGLCLVFARYVAKFHPDLSHNKAAGLLMGSLCGFLLFAAYNESLFLLLAVSCLWAMRDERFWLAGLFGGLAALTRQQGIALLLPLIWQIAITRRAGWHTFFAPLLVLCGYGAFVAYRLFVLHDADFSRAHSPLEIVRMILVSPSAQNMVLGQQLDWPWNTIIEHARRINGKTLEMLWDLLFGLIMVFWALFGWKKLHPAERIFALTIVLLTLCYANEDKRPLLSMPRHIMLAFPLYISLARWVEQKSGAAGFSWGRIVFQFAFIANLFLAGLYFHNRWVP